MKKTAIAAILCAATAGILSMPGSAQEQDIPWKPTGTKNGVELFKRQYPGSGIIEVKAVTIVDAAPEVIESVIRDIPAYPEFMYDCIEGREIKQFDDEHIVILNITKMPWPVQPREVVVNSVVKKDFENGRFEVALVGMAEGESEKWVPLTKGRVRMYELTGTFIGELLERNKCRMTYIVHANPRGIPPFVVNLMIDKNPLGTLLGLKRMVSKEKYIELGKQSKYLPFIEQYFQASAK